VRCAHRGEGGQALLLALVTLLLASIAAGLVALDLTWRERALQEQAARAHLRAQLDGEMATAVARLAADLPVDADEHRWPGNVTGTSSAEAEELASHRFRVTVHADYAGRRGAAQALVVTRPETRVFAWHRVTAQ
jgi:hypothetical protein